MRIIERNAGQLLDPVNAVLHGVIVQMHLCCRIRDILAVMHEREQRPGQVASLRVVDLLQDPHVLGDQLLQTAVVLEIQEHMDQVPLAVVDDRILQREILLHLQTGQRLRIILVKIRKRRELHADAGGHVVPLQNAGELVKVPFQRVLVCDHHDHLVIKRDHGGVEQALELALEEVQLVNGSRHAVVLNAEDLHGLSCVQVVERGAVLDGLGGGELLAEDVRHEVLDLHLYVRQAGQRIHQRQRQETGQNDQAVLLHGGHGVIVFEQLQIAQQLSVACDAHRIDGRTASGAVIALQEQDVREVRIGPLHGLVYHILQEGFRQTVILQAVAERLIINAGIGSGARDQAERGVHQQQRVVQEAVAGVEHFLDVGGVAADVHQAVSEITDLRLLVKEDQDIVLDGFRLCGIFHDDHVQVIHAEQLRRDRMIGVLHDHKVLIT